MKLYATTTSERASKGQGGNKLLDIDVIAGGNRAKVLSISFKADSSIDKYCINVTSVSGEIWLIRQLKNQLIQYEKDYYMGLIINGGR